MKRASQHGGGRRRAPRASPLGLGAHVPPELVEAYGRGRRDVQGGTSTLWHADPAVAQRGGLAGDARVLAAHDQRPGLAASRGVRRHRRGEVVLRRVKLHAPGPQLFQRPRQGLGEVHVRVVEPAAGDPRRAAVQGAPGCARDHEGPHAQLQGAAEDLAHVHGRAQAVEDHQGRLQLRQGPRHRESHGEAAGHLPRLRLVLEEVPEELPADEEDLRRSLAGSLQEILRGLCGQQH
mmetsp:Transcript_104056/g.315795  ORF Transcript_104056/g.315795 Transcript_104056/m.315795 type:complete len:235 (+) Transcript_104056:32-736(+)